MTAKTQMQIAPAKVLPFRVIAFRVPAKTFDEIQEQLRLAAHIVGLDAPLDWEDRETACRAIWDALSALAEIRGRADFKM